MTDIASKRRPRHLPNKLLELALEFAERFRVAMVTTKAQKRSTLVCPGPTLRRNGEKERCASDVSDLDKREQRK